MTIYSGWQLEVKTAQDLDTLTGSSLVAQSLLGITKVTTEYSNSLSPQKNVGDRTVYTYLEGSILLSGTIERYFSDTTSYIYSRGTNESGSLGFIGGIGIYPNRAVSGQPYVALWNVKFGDHRTQNKPGASLMAEILDFVATRQFTGSLP